MDEGPLTHPGIPTETYRTLGRKTFAIFLLQRMNVSAVLLLIAIGLFAIRDENFLKATPVGNLTAYASLAAWSVFGIFAAVFVVTFVVVWLIYINYKFLLGEDALKIKRGVLNKEEVAIPYRQVQNVDIQRDLSFQMLGLSRLVVLTAGEAEEKTGEDQSEGVLPALDKHLAEWLQAELLRRANVEKVTEAK